MDYVMRCKKCGLKVKHGWAYPHAITHKVIVDSEKKLEEMFNFFAIRQG